jgi:hypothetical protein
VDKVIGKVTTGQESILEGGHHIVNAVKLADGLTGLRAGTILYRDTGGWRPLPASYSTEQPAAILLDDVKGTTSGTVEEAALHGAVRCGKVMFANGAPATMGAADDLRMAGIYLLGDPLPSAAAPVIVADLDVKYAGVGDPLILTFLVTPVGEGNITRQWFSNSSASTSGGTAIEGAIGENYTVDTTAVGTKFFYCVATSHLNNTEASVTSAACIVTISA